MSVLKALSRIRLQNDDDVFLMSEYETDNKLFLKIINIKRNEIYVGHASNVELRSQAAKIRLTFSEFIRKVTKALFERTPDCSDFLYCLDKSDEKCIFKWKSIDHEETIINLGNVAMEKKDFVFMLTDVLQSISEEMRMCNAEVQELSAELNQSKVQTSEALKQLELATDVKVSLEREMYSKFVLVLNEKKRKIKELQQKTKTGPPHSNNNIPQRKKLKKSSQRVLSEIFSSSDDTDDIDQPGPSTTTTRKSLLFLDDNKSIASTSQKRIRNRKVPSSKKDCSNNVSTLSECSRSNNKIIEDKDESDESLLNCL